MKCEIIVLLKLQFNFMSVKIEARHFEIICVVTLNQTCRLLNDYDIIANRYLSSSPWPPRVVNTFLHRSQHSLTEGLLSTAGPRDKQAGAVPVPVCTALCRNLCFSLGQISPSAAGSLRLISPDPDSLKVQGWLFWTQSRWECEALPWKETPHTSPLFTGTSCADQSSEDKVQECQEVWHQWEVW